MLKKKMVHSLLCCGLDPDPSKIPNEKSATDEKKIENFLKQIIDLTHSNVCAYKIQRAFFDNLPQGHALLKTTISYIHSLREEIPVIIDSKIGDIENTMLAYLSYVFEELEADGIVINPYMGDDVIKPIEKYPCKAIVVLAKTSNPGGNIVQNVQLKSGLFLWQYILKLIIERWNSAGNMIPVISSTAKLDMANIRKLIPDEMPILLAGVGAQGGSYKNLSKLLNSEKSGVFVNSSRGILYPQVQNGQTWQDAVGQSCLKLKNDLDSKRK